MDWVYRRPADRQPLRRLFSFAGEFSLNAVLPIVFDVVADLKAGGQLAAVLPIEFNVVADLKAQGQLAAALPIEFGITADLKAQGQLASVLPIEFDVVANLNPLQAAAVLPIEFALAGSLVDSGAPVAPSGGHFIPQMPGVVSGKRKPQKALEDAEDILDQVVAEVLDTPKRPVQRVSRRMKSQIIEIATQRLLSERVLIGEIDAIDRAAARLAKLAIKRRIAARKLELVPKVVSIIPDKDQDIAAFMFRLLDQDDPERDELLARLEVQKEQDEELILLMQILLML